MRLMFLVRDCWSLNLRDDKTLFCIAKPMSYLSSLRRDTRCSLKLALGAENILGSLPSFSAGTQPVLSQEGETRKQHDEMCTIRKATSLSSPVVFDLGQFC